MMRSLPKDFLCWRKRICHLNSFPVPSWTWASTTSKSAKSTMFSATSGLSVGSTIIKDHLRKSHLSLWPIGRPSWIEQNKGKATTPKEVQIWGEKMFLTLTKAVGLSRDLSPLPMKISKENIKENWNKISKAKWRSKWLLRKFGSSSLKHCLLKENIGEWPIRWPLWIYTLRTFTFSKPMKMEKSMTKVGKICSWATRKLWRIWAQTQINKNIITLSKTSMTKIGLSLMKVTLWRCVLLKGDSLLQSVRVKVWGRSLQTRKASRPWLMEIGFTLSLLLIKK